MKPFWFSTKKWIIFRWWFDSVFFAHYRLQHRKTNTKLCDAQGLGHFHLFICNDRRLMAYSHIYFIWFGFNLDNKNIWKQTTSIHLKQLNFNQKLNLCASFSTLFFARKPSLAWDRHASLLFTFILDYFHHDVIIS